MFLPFCRFVMMPGEEKEEVFSLQPTILKEGETWGREMKEINKWVGAEGIVRIKVIIYYLRL